MVFKVLAGDAVTSVRKYMYLWWRGWRLEGGRPLRQKEAPDCLPRDESSPCVSEMIDKFRKCLKR